MKIIFKLFPIALIILILFIVSCNLQTNTTFPGNGINQIEISSIQVNDKDGNAVNSIVRGNTVLIKLAVKNYKNTYTISYYVKENTGTLSQVSQNEIVYTSSYRGGTYHIYISATDSENTATAVCTIDVLNRSPEIENINYLSSVSGNNTISATISDPDTVPATTINVLTYCNTGTLFNPTAQIVNSGDFTTVWKPNAVNRSVTVTISFVVTDDNPNTTNKTISFYYNK